MSSPVEIPHLLEERSCRNCTPVYVIRGSELKQFPDCDLQQATLTFIRTQGSCYAVTAAHVLEPVRRAILAGADPLTLVVSRRDSGTFSVDPNAFVTPIPGLLERDMDLAYAQIDEERPRLLGVEPLDLDRASPREEPAHLVCIGFPSERTRRTRSGALARQCCIALAERQSADSRFLLFGETEVASGIREFGGMSGGPVVWTSNEEYGLVGIVEEALPTRSEGPRDRIAIYAQRVTKELFMAPSRLCLPAV